MLYLYADWLGVCHDGSMRTWLVFVLQESEVQSPQTITGQASLDGMLFSAAGAQPLLHGSCDCRC